MVRCGSGGEVAEPAAAVLPALLLTLAGACNAASGAPDSRAPSSGDPQAADAAAARSGDAPVIVEGGSPGVACEEPPPGMVCIPGGPAVLGADDQGPAQAPRHTVMVPTFYMDQYEVTNAQVAACEAAAVCPRRSGYP